MFDALRERLLQKTELYQEEIVLFLWDKFKVYATTYSVARAQISWARLKKTIRQVAKGRNAHLRDIYVHNINNLPS